MLPITPSQTIGPFFGHALPWPDGPEVVPADTPGALWIRGQVFDGAGEPMPDALIETWQADALGCFDHPDDPRGRAVGFRGFGRCPTDPGGHYGIRTVKPGPVPGPDGTEQAPHIAVTVLARGLLRRLVTRIYFADEADANASDPVLALVQDVARVTLMAQPSEDGYGFDIRLQGEHATVFLDL